MITINERTAGAVLVNFFDKDGAAAVPTAVTYRIDCMKNAQQVRAWSAITPAAAVEIALTSDDTALINRSNTTEQKRVTVVAAYGVGNADRVTTEVDYIVKRLAFMGEP